MLHKSFDDALMNSAYLSELWAVNDLLRLKKVAPQSWTNENETQLQDEIRHASMILAELKKNNSVVVKDIKYSMQEKLYKPFIDLSSSNGMAEILTVHNMTEERAVWIYTTYQRFGKNAGYKKLAAQIKNEEAEHFKVTTDRKKNNLIGSLLDSSIKAIDGFIFNTHLPKKYGRLLFASEAFWNDYYQGAVLVDAAEARTPDAKP